MEKETQPSPENKPLMGVIKVQIIRSVMSGEGDKIARALSLAVQGSGEDVDRIYDTVLKMMKEIGEKKAESLPAE